MFLQSIGENYASDEELEEMLSVFESNYKSYFHQPNEDTLAGGLSNTIAGRIANYLDLHGGGYVVDGVSSDLSRLYFPLDLSLSYL